MDDERDDGLGEWMPIGAVVAQILASGLPPFTVSHAPPLQRQGGRHGVDAKRMAAVDAAPARGARRRCPAGSLEKEGQREDPPAVGAPTREECRAWEGRHAGSEPPFVRDVHDVRTRVCARGGHRFIPRARR